ncbi:MAG: glycerophosphodiester phosphodiesterase family protein [Gammaproteobacteria bacterium]|nr:glycerophosphodiester phosphodiesterase family protein [Gammaproteobacteria bacterium]
MPHCSGLASDTQPETTAPVIFEHASPIDPHQSILIIGHRGAAGLLPENTLPSFARACELGVGAVELDVHSVEDRLVVIHDDTLGRTTNATGPVTARSVAGLQMLDAGGGAGVPLLDEVFQLLPKCIGINVELKGANTALSLARFLGDHGDRDVLVSSFDHAALTAFRHVCTKVAVAPLFGRWRPNVWQLAEGLGAWSINLSARIATPERIAQAHRLGYRVLVYTVNDLNAAAPLVESAVDGVFTDYPDRITPDSLGGSILC